MKPNILKRLSALAMTAVMAFSISGGVSAADAATATIDTSRSTSLTIYKYDLTGAENDGVWDSQSYVSTGLADEQVNTALNQYAIQGVEFSYTLVEKGRINKRGKAVFDLAINPSEAEIVQLIFDLYANEGYGSQRISHYLFHKGVIGRSGTNIPNTSINRILKNVMYTGIIKNGPARSEPIEELRIIPDDLFNRTQQIMVSRRQHRNKVPLNSAGSSLLVDRVFCGHCGNRLTLTTSGKTYVRKNGSVYHQTKVRYFGISRKSSTIACCFSFSYKIKNGKTHISVDFPVWWTQGGSNP